MPAFLLFSLWAPLAAMGDVAVGERRTGLERPGKSAVLGLVAAALGIDRTEEAALRALHDGYGLAVRVDTPGTLVTDFHTAQVQPARRGRRWPTRRAELARPKPGEPELETVLSWREYRADARFTIALWPRRAAPRPLAELEQALRRPVHTLYLGRKACPLGAPPAPVIVEAPTLSEALAVHDRHCRPGIDTVLPRPQAVAAPAVYADIEPEGEARLELGPGLTPHHRRMRRDDPISRRRWQFRLREEQVARTVPPGDPS